MSEGLPRFGPKAEDHPTVGGRCPACGVFFVAGDYTTIVAMGPGNDLEQRKRAAAGKPYNAIGLEVHYVCATGIEDAEEVGEEGGDAA